jgi:hypothetical protein
MKIVLSIIGGILMFLGLQKLYNIFQVYQMFGGLCNQGMMNDQIGIGLIICIGGAILLAIAGLSKKSAAPPGGGGGGINQP